MAIRPKIQPAHQHPRGFTLIEVLVVLTIVAGLMGAAVYGLGMVTASDLRDQAMRLTAVMKDTWSRAATEQVNYRLVLDLDANSYWVEVSDADVVTRLELQEKFDADNKRARLEEERQRDANRRNAAASDLFVDSDPFGISRATRFEPADSEAIDHKNFRDGIRLHQVLTTAQDTPITQGQVAVSFFPDGFQEPIIIVLKDERGSYYSLVNEPLTGRVKIYSRLIEDRDLLDLGEDND